MCNRATRTCNTRMKAKAVYGAVTRNTKRPGSGGDERSLMDICTGTFPSHQHQASFNLTQYLYTCSYNQADQGFLSQVIKLVLSND